MDDSSIIVKANTHSELLTKLKEEYNALSTFLIDHLMVINAAKTQIMIINPPKEEPPEQINSIIIENNIIQHQKLLEY